MGAKLITVQQERELLRVLGQEPQQESVQQERELLRVLGQEPQQESVHPERER